MPILLAFVGLAIDGGMLFYQRRLLQNAADAAALAGALEISACGGTVNCSAMQAAAQSAVTEMGLTGSSLLQNCASRDVTRFQVTINNPPCAVSTDPNASSGPYVEVVISRPVPTAFMRVLGINSVPMLARGEATVAPILCSFFLSTYYTQTSLQVNNQTISAACPLYLGQAYTFSGASSSGSQFYVAGNSAQSTGSVSPTPVFNAPVQSDPLGTVPTPTFSACNYTNLTVTTNQSLSPGVYCGYLRINTTGTVTLAAGTYTILGSLTVNQGNLTGTGVTFFLSQGLGYTYGASTIQNLNATLSAPTSGTLQGVLYMSDRTLPGGAAGLSLQNWNPGTRLDGIFYLPGQKLTASNVTLKGNRYFGVVVDWMQMNNTTFVPSSDYSTLANGDPFHPKKDAFLVQ